MLKYPYSPPYIGGYFFLLFGDMTSLDSTLVPSRDDLLLSANVLSFTPPSITLGRTEIPVWHHKARSVVTGYNYTYEFTVTLRMDAEQHIYRIILDWVDRCNDEYIESNHKGAVYLPFTAPIRVDMITDDCFNECLVFHGIKPMTPAYDMFATDITAPDLKQISVTFTFYEMYKTKFHDIRSKVEDALHRLTELVFADVKRILI